MHLPRLATIAATMLILVAACSGDSGAGPDPQPTVASPVTTEATGTPSGTPGGPEPTDAPGTTTSPLDTTGPGVPLGEAPATDDFEVSDCPFTVPAGFDVTCGWLYVPEDRSDPASAELALAVAIVHPAGEATGTPIVYLEGGPGGSALYGFETDPEFADLPFLEGREFVLLDQRGTGYSWPTLDCPEFQTDQPPGDQEQACYERLVAEGIDLTAYTTEANADDVVDLQAALGIDQWDLYGISYGTHLGMEVMRRHPEGIGAVILDSPYPPNVDLAVDSVFSFLGRFQQLLDDCSVDEYCAATYPDLGGTFLATVERLNAEGTDFFGDDLAVAVGQALADTGAIPWVPWMISEVAAGNFDAVGEVLGESGYHRYQEDADVSDSEGMNHAVQCADYAVGDLARAEAAAIGTVPTALEAALLDEVVGLERRCAYWNPVAMVDDTAVVSDIPALILVGSYDPLTPPEWAYLAAEGLSTAYVIEFPGTGHSVSTAWPCGAQIISGFLADPLTPPDQSCIADIEWPYFE